MNSVKKGQDAAMGRLLIACGLSGLLLIGGCVTTAAQAPTQNRDRDYVMAENSQMKKRLSLVERENDVLNQENLQYKKKLHQTTAANEKLNADLSNLSEKYGMDMAQSEEQITNLTDKYNRLEAESTRKYTELTGRYNTLEVKRSQEVKELNHQIVSQKNAFSLERDQFKQASAKRELDLNEEIAGLKKNIKDQEMQVAALENAKGEMAQKIDDISARLEASQSANQQIESELAALKAAHTDLQRKLETLSSSAAVIKN
jgi:chromosome segregation ATPase